MTSSACVKCALTLKYLHNTLQSQVLSARLLVKEAKSLSTTLQILARPVDDDNALSSLDGYLKRLEACVSAKLDNKTQQWQQIRNQLSERCTNVVRHCMSHCVNEDIAGNVDTCNVADVTCLSDRHYQTELLQDCVSLVAQIDGLLSVRGFKQASLSSMMQFFTDSLLDLDQTDMLLDCLATKLDEFPELHAIEDEVG